MRLLPSALTSGTARGAAGTFGLRAFAGGCSALAALVLTRSLGAAQYGGYAYALAWVNLLVMPATFGLDRLLVRQAAAYAATQSWSLLRGLLRWGGGLSLALSLGLAGVAVFAVPALSGSGDAALLGALPVAVVLVPIVVVIRLRQATLQGLRQVVRGQTPELLVRPLLFLALLAGTLAAGGHLTGVRAMVLQVVAATVAAGFGVLLLARALPQDLEHAAPAYDIRAWLSACVPMLLVAAMYTIQAQLDVAMLGTLRGAAEAGVFAVADRGASVIVLMMMGVNTALMPRIAELHAAGRQADLQRLVTHASRLVFLSALPVAAGLFLLAPQLLALFGPEFPAGTSALRILSMAQLVSAYAASTGALLLMTGHERSLARVVAASTVLNAALNVALIPRFGVTGAAVATLCSLALARVVNVVQVRRLIGIRASVFADWFPRSGASESRSAA